MTLQYLNICRLKIITFFSNLKGYDLQELFALENKYQLELRDSINLDCDNTFGLEIEFEGINTVTTRLLLERYFRNYGQFVVTHH